MKRSIYEIKTSRGTDQRSSQAMVEDGRGTRLINLIYENGMLTKRQGVRLIAQITDEQYAPAPINGIFEYGEKYIIHAGEKLYLANSDFLTFSEIPLDDKIEIKNQRSRAYLSGERLYIGGCGDLLYYDGEKVKRLYSCPEAYVPTTTIGIRDRRAGMGKIKNESANMLTPVRINKLVGSSIYYDEGIAPVYLLDKNVKSDAPFEALIRIRVRTKNDPIDSCTTQYIGVDENGNEVNTIITIRLYLDSTNEASTFFVGEPMLDDNGKKIRIKFDDDNEIYDYDRITFGAKIRNGNELYFTFNVLTPVEGEDNITVIYSADEDENEHLLGSTSVIATCPTSDGGDALMLSCGGNDVRYTDSKRGYLYLPEENLISVGDNSPITAIYPLSDNYIGIFKKRSFYRVRLKGSLENRSHEIFSSSLFLGAKNNFCISSLDYDTLVLGEDGIYGTEGTSENGNMYNSLKLRSKNILNLLSRHTEGELKNAVSITHQRKYYLFIGDTVYVASYDSRWQSTEGFEYEWYIWEGIRARCLLSSKGRLYIGEENGELLILTNQKYDEYTTEYSQSKATLVLENGEEYTRVILDSLETITSGEKIKLSTHNRLFSKNVTYVGDGLFAIEEEEFFKNGVALLYDGMVGRLMSDSGEVVAKGEITQASPYDLCFTCPMSSEIDEGTSLSLYLTGEWEYTLQALDGHLALLYNGERAQILENEGITAWLIKEKEIKCIFETGQLPISKGYDLKTLYGIYFKPLISTQGEVNFEVESKRGVQNATLKINQGLDFEGLSFEELSFNGSFERIFRVNIFEKDFEYIKIKISSSSKKDFGIEGVSLLYTTKKQKGGR